MQPWSLSNFQEALRNSTNNNVNRVVLGRHNVSQLQSLPPATIHLQCESLDLAALPVLPLGLVSLSCRWNQLTRLPRLPDSLISLNCENNQLTELPELPDSLSFLNCGWNQLTRLPRLPDSLTRLSCENNQLTELPELPPGLVELFCGRNPISSINLDSVQGPLRLAIDIANLDLTSLRNLKNNFGKIIQSPISPIRLSAIETRIADLELEQHVELAEGAVGTERPYDRRLPQAVWGRILTNFTPDGKPVDQNGQPINENGQPGGRKRKNTKRKLKKRKNKSHKKIKRRTRK